MIVPLVYLRDGFRCQVINYLLIFLFKIHLSDLYTFALFLLVVLLGVFQSIGFISGSRDSPIPWWEANLDQHRVCLSSM